MKRIKAACILQALVFSQKPELGLSRDEALKANHAEIEHYKKLMDRTKTRYVIDEETEQEDGSVIVRVKKQYNDKADVTEYFN